MRIDTRQDQRSEFPASRPTTVREELNIYMNVLYQNGLAIIDATKKENEDQNIRWYALVETDSEEHANYVQSLYVKENGGKKFEIEKYFNMLRERGVSESVARRFAVYAHYEANGATFPKVG